VIKSDASRGGTAVGENRAPTSVMARDGGIYASLALSRHHRTGATPGETSYLDLLDRMMVTHLSPSLGHFFGVGDGWRIPKVEQRGFLSRQ
jgi:hypothetical protein